jgi:hypothetical protein
MITSYLTVSCNLTPNSSFWSWEMCEALGTWAGAVLTILLLVVTLYEVGLLDHRFGPVIELSWGEHSPTLQATKSREETESRSMPYQLRLKASNLGNRPAQNVSIFLKGVRTPSATSVDYRFSDFVPARLKWTHLSSPQCEFIAPDSFALCDLGILDPIGDGLTEEFVERLEGSLRRGTLPISTYVVRLCLEAMPQNGGGIFGAGIYQFEFEIIDKSGVCGAGEIKMAVGSSPSVDDCEFPPIEVQINHYGNKRWRRLRFLA